MEIFFAILTVFVGLSALISPVIVFKILERKEQREKLRSFEIKRKLLFDDALQELFRRYEIDRLTLSEIEGLPDILAPKVYKRLSDVDMLVLMKADYAEKQCESDEEFAELFSNRYRLEYDGELGDSLANFVLCYIKILAALQKQCEFLEDGKAKSRLGDKSIYEWMVSGCDADEAVRAKIYDRNEYKKSVSDLSDAYRRVQMVLFNLEVVRFLGKWANLPKPSEKTNA